MAHAPKPAGVMESPLVPRGRVGKVVVVGVMALSLLELPLRDCRWQ
jgi:hypothetical protein